MVDYSISTKFKGTMDEALEKTTRALQKQGFGVLFDIDISAKMKEKIGKDMPAYRILGACHPPSAYEVIQVEPEIGLFLPCNVLLREDHGGVQISTIKPTIMLGMVEADIKSVAQDIEERLKNVIALIERK